MIDRRKPGTLLRHRLHRAPYLSGSQAPPNEA